MVHHEKPAAGDRYGRLLLVRFIRKELKRCPNSIVWIYFWLCLCDCGRKVEVNVRKVIYGDARSCGCLRSELSRKRLLTHGAKSGGFCTPEYYSWVAMRTRCCNPKSKSFSRYGGRGISVCKKWSESFPRFLRDMGPRPQGTTLGRLKSDRNYSPKNCRWETHVEQASNRSNNRLLFFRGKASTISEWSRETGLGKGTILSRIDNGWSVRKSLSTPVRRKV